MRTINPSAADQGPLANALHTTVYGPDRRPVASRWHLLDDFRPTDFPDPVSVRLTVVRRGDGRWAVRVASVGLERLGLDPTAVAEALALLVDKWRRANTQAADGLSGGLDRQLPVADITEQFDVGGEA